MNVDAVCVAFLHCFINVVSRSKCLVYSTYYSDLLDLQWNNSANEMKGKAEDCVLAKNFWHDAMAMMEAIFKFHIF